MDSVTFLPSFGNLLYTAVAFIIALSVIVFIHEFGHYIVGRWSGIKAEVFSIGFGPVIASRVDRHGTRWQIAAVPLGGYVKFLGDANAASAGADESQMARLSAAEKRHTMHGAPLWARAATVAAGPVFNFVLSVILFALVFQLNGFAVEEPTVGALHTLPGGTGEVAVGDQIARVEAQPVKDFTELRAAVDAVDPAATMQYGVLRAGAARDVTGPALFPPRVASVTPGSAAADAGLKTDDVITAIGGTPINTFAELQQVVKAGDGAPVTLSVWRAGTALEVTLTPRRTDLPLADGTFETRYLIGIGGDFFFQPTTRTPSPVEALNEGASQVWFVARSSISALTHMVGGSISACNLRGPIGIAETSGAAASEGVQSFLWFIAVLSTAVGLMNLFPIPVLDGGHLIFHAWEWATGKPPSDAALRLLMTLGLFVILALTLFGITNDLRCP